MRSWLSRKLLALVMRLRRPAEPGAAVYFRTTPLSEAGREDFERALGKVRLPIAEVATRGVPGEPAEGWAALDRGRDGPSERARLLAWLRARPEVAAAGEDEAATVR